MLFFSWSFNPYNSLGGTLQAATPSRTAPALASPWNFRDVFLLFILCKRSRALGTDGAPPALVIIAVVVALKHSEGCLGR